MDSWQRIELQIETVTLTKAFITHKRVYFLFIIRNDVDFSHASFDGERYCVYIRVSARIIVNIIWVVFLSEFSAKYIQELIVFFFYMKILLKFEL